MNDNLLNEVDTNTFSWERSKLRELHLNHNNLQKIPDGMFAESSQLQTILLRNNSISYIGRRFLGRMGGRSLFLLAYQIS